PDNGTTPGLVGPGSNGTDTLLNIEQLRFADVTIPVPSPSVLVPNVVGSAEATADAAVIAAGLTVGIDVFITSPTVAAGNVISQSPLAGASAAVGSSVTLTISTGSSAGPVIAGTVRTNSSIPNTVITSPTTGALAANTLLVAFVSANNGNSTVPNTIVNNVLNQNGAALTW